jgi:hypothetical protein
MNFNLEKIIKKNKQEELKFFSENFTLNGITYNVVLDQDRTGMFNVSFDADGSSYLTNKGFSHNNELFKKIAEFVLRICEQEHISEIFYWTSSEKLSFEKISEIKDSFRDILDNYPDIFQEEKILVRSNPETLPLTVSIKNNKMIKKYDNEYQNLRQIKGVLTGENKKEINLTSLIKSNDTTKFGQEMLDSRCVKELFNAYDLPELEKYEKLFLGDEDSEKKSRQRAMLYERVIKNIFPDAEILEEDGGYLIKINQEYLSQ